MFHVKHYKNNIYNFANDLYDIKDYNLINISLYISFTLLKKS